MKQPTINIKDIHDTDYGIKDVVQINWARGKIYFIVVDMMGDGIDLMAMHNYEKDNEFKNSRGNLMGVFPDSFFSI